MGPRTPPDRVAPPEKPPVPRPARRRAAGPGLLLVLAAAVPAAAGPPAPRDPGAPSARTGLLSPAGRDRPTLFEWGGCGGTAGCDETAAGGSGEADGGAEPLVAERPDFTNSPSTVGRGVAQVEVGYRFTYDGGPDGETRAHSLPDGLLRVGVGADWLELRLAGTEIIEQRGGPDPGNAGDRRDGTEGVDLGAKFGLFPQAGALPEIALITTVTLPTAADLVRVDRPLPGVELVYGWEVTDDLRIAGSTQANRTADDDGRDVFTEYAQSLTAGFTPTDRFGVYAEVYVLAPADTAFAETEYYADAGLTVLATDDVQLDGFVGTGLNGPADDFFAGVGMVVRFR